MAIDTATSIVFTALMWVTYKVFIERMRNKYVAGFLIILISASLWFSDSTNPYSWIGILTGLILIFSTGKWSG